VDAVAMVAAAAADAAAIVVIAAVVADAAATAADATGKFFFGSLTSYQMAPSIGQSKWNEKKCAHSMGARLFLGAGVF
jgi:hypothetical protein